MSISPPTNQPVDSPCNEQRNGNGKWENSFVWVTRALIGLLTFLALTIWNDLRAVGDDVATLRTDVKVQQRQLDDHIDNSDRRLGALEHRVYNLGAGSSNSESDTPKWWQQSEREKYE